MDSALAARVVALPGWRWLPGMLAVYPGRDRSPYGEARLSWTVTDDGERAEYMGLDYVGAFPTWGCPSEGSSWLPDLSDPATGGALASLLPADASIHRTPRESGPLWRIVITGADGRRHAVSGDTLGHAAAAALVAVGRCE